MKKESDRPMRTLGSLALSRSLLQAGLVDRYRVVVFPSSPVPPAGTGSSTGTPTSLELVDHRTFDGRLRMLDYIPTILDGPPGAGESPSA